MSLLSKPSRNSPREKFLARLQQQTTLGSGSEERVAITLPRLSFEMTGISYDPGRKINKNLKYLITDSKGKILKNSSDLKILLKYINWKKI